MRVPRLAAVSIGVAVFAVLLACGEDPTSAADLSMCGSDGYESPVFTVAGGTQPTISWTPACRLGSLAVIAEAGPAGGGVRWATFHTQGLLVPPIGWGALQPGAQQGSAARPLLPRSTYRIFASQREPVVGGNVFSFASLPFTACGTGAGVGCVTTQEIFSGGTADGVTISAATSATTIARGDTAWIAFTLRNTTSESRSVGFAAPCGSFRIAIQRADWNRVDFFSSDCARVLAPISVPAGGATTLRYPFTGYLPNGVTCLRPDRYQLALRGESFNGALREGSNAVAVTVREPTTSGASCTDVF